MSCEVVVLKDDDVVRDVLSDIVACIGLTVTSVASAAEALEHIQASQGSALLLTDIDLGPGGNGFEAAREAQRRYPGLPVIYMTGFPALSKDREFIPNERFLSKPFRTLELIVAIRSLGIDPLIT